jgi:DNA-directed RNA polymerase subunit RPC12/RpoP
MKKEVYVCEECGSEDIEQQAWCKVNEKDFTGMPTFSSWQDDQYFCMNCMDNIKYITTKEEWNKREEE